MKRLLPLALATVALSAGAYAQDPAVDKALLAAPAQNKAGAMVIKWKDDFTYDTLRKATGNSRMVCYDLSGKPTHERTPIMAECTTIGNLDRVAQNLKFEAISDKTARDAAFANAEKDGTRVKPEFGSPWIHAMGADPQNLRIHTTIAVPGATEKSMGLPESGAKGDVWIMNAGTTTAHLMLPGQ